MAKYRNAKPGVLGLTFKNADAEGNGGTNPRTIGPGEVFEADAAEVPEHYLKQGWIVEAGKDDKVGPPVLDAGEPARTTADAPLTPAPQPGADAQRTDAQRAASEQQQRDAQRAQSEHQSSDDKRNKR